MHNSYYVLRTLNVLPEMHRQRIGTHLIKTLLDSFPYKSTVYCLPYPHLQKLYEKFGFKRIDHQNLPKELKERYFKYVKEFDVIAMKLLV